MCVVGVCAATAPQRSLAASDGISTFELSYILYAAQHSTHLLIPVCLAISFGPLFLFFCFCSYWWPSLLLPFGGKKWVFFSRSANHRRIRRRSRRHRCPKCISARAQSDKRWEMWAKETATQKKMKIVKTKGGHCHCLLLLLIVMMVWLFEYNIGSSAIFLGRAFQP